MLCTLHAAAQADAAFLRHLSANGLQCEQERYLQLLPETDSTFYHRAAFYLETGRDSLFLENYSRSALLCKSDALLEKKADVFFLRARRESLSFRWFEQKKQSTLQTGTQLAWEASFQPKLYTKENFPQELQGSFSDYKKSARKNPLVAAALSTLLPGAGKLYAGKRKTFFLSFVLCASYGIQTAESAVKLGPQHIFTLINAAAFSVFYLSNIYGSYTSVTQLRKERRIKFLNDAANYYY